ncbi:MAG: HTH domain-containing protein, partial [Ignavibacteria bacterium]|nr:HTH domain-containing protein [Ignavibacteria bacterium]
EGSVFKTIIPLDESLADTLNDVDAVNDTLKATDRINDTVTDTLNDNDAVIDTVTDTLNPNDRINDRINDGIKSGAIDSQSKDVLLKLSRLTQFIYITPLMNAEELASKLNISISTVNRYLKTLKLIGVSELHGARKTGGYIITPSFESEIIKGYKI